MQWMVRPEYHCLLPLFNQFAFSLISESEPNIQVCPCCGLLRPPLPRAALLGCLMKFWKFAAEGWLGPATATLKSPPPCSPSSWPHFHPQWSRKSIMKYLLFCNIRYSSETGQGVPGFLMVSLVWSWRKIRNTSVIYSEVIYTDFNGVRRRWHIYLRLFLKCIGGKYLLKSHVS